MLAAEFQVVTEHISTRRYPANVEDTNGKPSWMSWVNSAFSSHSTAWHTLHFTGYSLTVQWTRLLAVLVLVLLSLYSTLTFITHNLFSFCAAISSETTKNKDTAREGWKGEGTSTRWWQRLGSWYIKKLKWCASEWVSGHNFRRSGKRLQDMQKLKK